MDDRRDEQERVAEDRDQAREPEIPVAGLSIGEWRQAQGGIVRRNEDAEADLDHFDQQEGVEEELLIDARLTIEEDSRRHDPRRPGEHDRQGVDDAGHHEQEQLAQRAGIRGRGGQTPEDRRLDDAAKAQNQEDHDRDKADGEDRCQNVRNVDRARAGQHRH